MPTLRGLRRRGYPASAIRDVLQLHRRRPHEQPAPIELLESFMRTELNAHRAAADGRAAAAASWSITNWPTDADGDPVVEHSRSSTTRRTPTTACARCRSRRSLFIEHDDFMDEPPPKYFRLTPGREVRLRGAYLVTVHRVRRQGRRRQRHRGATCTYDPATSGRQRARRPQGEVDDALGVGRPRRRRHGGAVRAAVLRRGAGRGDGRRRSTTSTPTRASCSPTARSSRHWPTPRRAPWCSSSGSATSPIDPTTPMLFHRTVGLRDEWANIQKRST